MAASFQRLACSPSLQAWKASNSSPVCSRCPTSSSTPLNDAPSAASCRQALTAAVATARCQCWRADLLRRLRRACSLQPDRRCTADNRTPHLHPCDYLSSLQAQHRWQDQPAVPHKPAPTQQGCAPHHAEGPVQGATHELGHDSAHAAVQGRLVQGPVLPLLKGPGHRQLAPALHSRDQQLLQPHPQRHLGMPGCQDLLLTPDNAVQPSAADASSITAVQQQQSATTYPWTMTDCPCWPAACNNHPQQTSTRQPDATHISSRSRFSRSRAASGPHARSTITLSSSCLPAR